MMSHSYLFGRVQIVCYVATVIIFGMMFYRHIHYVDSDDPRETTTIQQHIRLAENEPDQDWQLLAGYYYALILLNDLGISYQTGAIVVLTLSVVAALLISLCTVAPSLIRRVFTGDDSCDRICESVFWRNLSAPVSFSIITSARAVQMSIITLLWW